MPIDASDLTAVGRKLASADEFLDPMRDVVSDASQDMLAHIRAEAPYRTGRLTRATQVHVSDDLSVTFDTPASTAPYAKFVYGGTRAHEVHARPGGVLVFLHGGGPVFAKHVHIPAIPANPYIARSFDGHSDEFNKALELGAEITIQKELEL